jgi:hypothetical protein
MEATCSSEESVDIQRTTRRYIPEDKTLHNHRCEDLKSYNIVLVSVRRFVRRISPCLMVQSQYSSVD